MRSAIVESQKWKFEMLKNAFKQVSVALLECTLQASGEKVTTVVTINYVESGQLELVPVCILPIGDLCELLKPSNGSPYKCQQGGWRECDTDLILAP